MLEWRIKFFMKQRSCTYIAFQGFHSPSFQFTLVDLSVLEVSLSIFYTSLDLLVLGRVNGGKAPSPKTGVPNLWDLVIKEIKSTINVMCSKHLKPSLVHGKIVISKTGLCKKLGAAARDTPLLWVSGVTGNLIFQISKSFNWAMFQLPLRVHMLLSPDFPLPLIYKNNYILPGSFQFLLLSLTLAFCIEIHRPCYNSRNNLSLPNSPHLLIFSFSHLVSQKLLMTFLNQALSRISSVNAVYVINSF